MRRYFLALVILLGIACKSQGVPSDTGGTSPVAGGATSSGGTNSAGGGIAGEGATGGGVGSGGSLPDPVPKLYPVPGFESCIHAEVTADCADGWCRLPPSCFVMGSSESEWMRGLDTENQVAVMLTHPIEFQQKELTRSQWKTI